MIAEVALLALCVTFLQVDAERRLRALAEEQAALTRATVEKEAATAAARAAADEQALLLQVCMHALDGTQLSRTFGSLNTQ